MAGGRFLFSNINSVQNQLAVVVGTVISCEDALRHVLNLDDRLKNVGERRQPTVRDRSFM